MSAIVDPTTYNVTRLEPKTKATKRTTSYDLHDLMSASFPELRWAIPGYVPEGLSILAGRQKLGKSRLALDFACAVASGGYAMGSVKCQQGAVLFLDLENGARRAKERLQSALPNWDSVPRGQLQIELEAKALDKGLMADLEAWRVSVQNPRLIIIDVLQRVKPTGRGNQNAYESDYEALSPLQQWATTNGLAVILIHHTKKGGADDPLEALSGSNGLSACADTTLVLDKSGNGVTLYVRGRDVLEKEDALESVGGGWSLLGEAHAIRRSDERGAILSTLSEATEPMSPKDIAVATGQNRNSLDQLLFKMAKAGEITKPKRGFYWHPDKKEATTDKKEATTDKNHSPPDKNDKKVRKHHSETENDIETEGLEE